MNIPKGTPSQDLNMPTVPPANNLDRGGSSGLDGSSDPIAPPALPNNDRASQQSAAAHIAVRPGEVLQALCYGPLQFSDLQQAYKDAMSGRALLDYALLKRLDNIIFHRFEGEAEYLADGNIRSMIITAETHLLLTVQQFMAMAALLPIQENFLHGDIPPDPLVKFVDDAEALVQYMLDDLREQPSLFAPSNINLEGFVRERCEFAKTSQSPSFYFRQENTSVTLRYVQGLCETICGLWPHGRFFISAEVVNPRDSFTPLHFHRPRSFMGQHFMSGLDSYFNDPGVLGHVVANDYRQLLRGAFPFLAVLGREADWFARPDRERDMSLDASFIDSGVFKFARTTLVREHLLLDSNRRVRVYVDEFEGTRLLVYFNHCIGR